MHQTQDVCARNVCGVSVYQILSPNRKLALLQYTIERSISKPRAK